ncbi:MAG: c-type cytochrome [Chloracidobacterium sp.]|nr:c-type cytochrome [Chloracidobacterium sp.]
MKQKLKLLVIVLGVALFAALAFKSLRADAQTQTVTAGQKFKNIKVLNDMPADQMGQVMNMMSASLGFNCAGCHAAGDKDFEKDTNDHKLAARKMLEMTFALNKQFFEGKPEVSCNTCHNGRERPVAVPNLLPTAPVERPKQPAIKPLIDDILTKYAASIGTKDSLAKVASRQIKANRIETDGKTIEPEEIWQKGGKFRSELKYADYVVTEVFDGKRSGNAAATILLNSKRQRSTR